MMIVSSEKGLRHYTCLWNSVEIMCMLW